MQVACEIMANEKIWNNINPIEKYDPRFKEAWALAVGGIVFGPLAQ